MASTSRKTRKYRSKFERAVDEQAARDGIKTEYEPKHRKIVWQPKQRTYLPDFLLPNGCLVETKGRLTPEDRAKLLCVKEQHPEVLLCLVFQRDNPLSKKSKTRYSEWAKKHGFPYSFKKIPKEWAK